MITRQLRLPQQLLRSAPKLSKFESVDTEGDDADIEKIPGAETPKKSRARKIITIIRINVTDDTTKGTAVIEIVILILKSKRKRSPNQLKDPNATPTKRA